MYLTYKVNYIFGIILSIIQILQKIINSHK